MFLAALWRHGARRGARPRAGRRRRGCAVRRSCSGPFYTRAITRIPPRRRSTIRRERSRFSRRSSSVCISRSGLRRSSLSAGRGSSPGSPCSALTRSAGLRAARARVHAGLTAHVRDIRAWAVAGPLLDHRRGGERCPAASLKRSRSSALATIVTLVIAAPVLRAPSERVFGMEIVGRHHDPFTVMQQFGGPIERRRVFAAGHRHHRRAARARRGRRRRVQLAGPPELSLVGGRGVSAGASSRAVAGRRDRRRAGLRVLAVSSGPRRLSPAHRADTVGAAVPAGAVALPRRRPRWRRSAFSALATVAVTLSNFYGGLIAAVITPIAVGAYWLVTRPAHRRPRAPTRVTVGSLVLIAACGFAYASYAARAVVADRAAFAFPRATCSATARHGGAISFRPSRIRCSAESRSGSGMPRACTKACSSSR